MRRLAALGRLGLANRAEDTHTLIMSLKNAALLALVGIALLTILLAAHLISTVLGVLRDLIPPVVLLSSLVHLFASVCVLMFLFVFYRKQS